MTRRVNRLFWPRRNMMTIKNHTFSFCEFLIHRGFVKLCLRWKSQWKSVDGAGLGSKEWNSRMFRSWAPADQFLSWSRPQAGPSCPLVAGFTCSPGWPEQVIPQSQFDGLRNVLYQRGGCGVLIRQAFSRSTFIYTHTHTHSLALSLSPASRFSWHTFSVSPSKPSPSPASPPVSSPPRCLLCLHSDGATNQQACDCLTGSVWMERVPFCEWICGQEGTVLFKNLPGCVWLACCCCVLYVNDVWRLQAVTCCWISRNVSCVFQHRRRRRGANKAADTLEL